MNQYNAPITTTHYELLLRDRRTWRRVIMALDNAGFSRTHFTITPSVGAVEFDMIRRQDGENENKPRQLSCNTVAIYCMEDLGFEANTDLPSFPISTPEGASCLTVD